MRKIILISALSLLSAGYVAESRFAITREGSITNENASFLGLGPKLPEPDGGIQFWIRDRSSTHPGDYYLYPNGADTTALTADESLEISSVLSSFIDSSYFDSLVLSNLTAFSYTMEEGKVKRREYHVRYSAGDTIFVISGWLGKFMSFYYAVPGETRISLYDLQQQVGRISPAYANTDTLRIRRVTDKWKYFIEYKDGKRLMRIRFYIIREIPYETWIAGGTKAKPYSLIEITKFIDKEAMP
ncbi:MAG: hypothetical protein A2W25_09600 [candidate division Zixibacteria bacterium RBG_16_53_22]|nr:MAG: hypothetical protein A2W25_09600 [candidate division Zixibacteria bacterium RBG_16_53_22]